MLREKPHPVRSSRAPSRIAPLDPVERGVQLGAEARFRSVVSRKAGNALRELITLEHFDERLHGLSTYGRLRNREKVALDRERNEVEPVASSVRAQTEAGVRVSFGDRGRNGIFTPFASPAATALAIDEPHARARQVMDAADVRIGRGDESLLARDEV